jgi:hypothetical protein
MRHHLAPRLWLAGLLALMMAACGSGNSPTSGDAVLSPNLAVLQQVLGAQGSTGGRRIEVLTSAVHLRINIEDAALAAAAQPEREAAADALVAQVEKAPISAGYLKGLQAISVAIVHAGAAPGGATADDMHVEDVITYHKSPDGRFVRHVS